MQKDNCAFKGWTLHTMNVETFDYNAESWVGETISKVMRRHQIAKRFNCGRIGHLRRDCRQGISRNNISSGNGEIGDFGLQIYVAGVAKADIGPMNAGQ